MNITITGVQSIDTTTRYEFGGEAMIIVDADRTFRVTSAEVSADGSVRVILVRRTLKGTDYKNGSGMWLSLDNVRDTEIIDAIVNTIETTNTGEWSHNDTPAETMIHNEGAEAPAQDEPCSQCGTAWGGCSACDTATEPWYTRQDPAPLEKVHGPVGGRERPGRGLSVRYRTRKPGHARKRRGVHR